MVEQYRRRCCGLSHLLFDLDSIIGNAIDTSDVNKISAHDLAILNSGRPKYQLESDDPRVSCLVFVFSSGILETLGPLSELYNPFSLIDP
jgi:hypothetical protein